MSTRSKKIRASRREKLARRWGAKENGPRAVAREPLIDSAAKRNLKPFPLALQGQRDI